MIRSFWNRLRLNLRALRHVATWNWLGRENVAESYDAIAATYDRDWLVHLQSTTDRLHGMLPEYLSHENKILELGCGSAYSTAWLRNRYPGVAITAIDISPGMIEKAKQRLGNDNLNVEFFCGDMLGQ